MDASSQSMNGQVCLVTGATSGIGAVTARVLAERGATLILAGRNPDKIRAAVHQLQTQSGNRQVDALLADLSSQQQIRQLAQQFRDRYSRLDVLVNNAGGIWMKRQVTADGLEMTFALNHLAYFLLTNLLLDVLKSSASPRIVNVASRAHSGAKLDFADLQNERRYSGWRAYTQSKLANVLFTYELARQLAGTSVTANALHPGFVATGFAGNNGWKGRLWQFLARWMAINSEEGARTILYLATSPKVDGVSGKYFDREQAIASSAASYDEGAARRLWQVSLELTGLVGTASPR
jgi:NAD(P)-dependent dehydrogenase (short-subunit alcohol dehydrogenase family)